MLAAVLCTALLTAGCAGSGDTGAEGDPVADVVSGIAPNPAIAAKLPPQVRASGRIRVATAAKGSPPIRYYSETNGKLIGVEIDLQQAVGRVLGVRMDSQDATFDEILPALGSGRYDLGQGNFGVTEERKKLVDFVTYYDDGFGFLVRAGRQQPPIQGPADLCGLRVGTTAGTSFEQVLHQRVGECAARSRADYHVSVYRSTADSMLALSQNKMDVLVSSSVFLQYAAERQRGRMTYVNKIYDEHVGFVLKHDSPLSEPLRLAVQQLIDDGAYQKIMAKWGLESAAIRQSQVNPPGLR
ncbi:ABC transporter substrate-binding protein [Kutzneria viridogrisea]|uniref:ABC transporter substrate-binding protein n=1 Tax=Kutzneria albida DSM 43870 TaxID=1449976 RepID=W5WGG2_9PSEU|nr:ABC transporter substrate-binding protein [Kutzneria albida DSM 43870]